MLHFFQSTLIQHHQLHYPLQLNRFTQTLACFESLISMDNSDLMSFLATVTSTNNSSSANTSIDFSSLFQTEPSVSSPSNTSDEDEMEIEMKKEIKEDMNNMTVDIEDFRNVIEEIKSKNKSKSMGFTVSALTDNGDKPVQ